MKVRYSFKEHNKSRIKSGNVLNKGVYLIVLGNGVYIGKTSNSFKERFTCHYTNLINNTHYNDKCLDSFNDNQRCIFIPLISFKTKDELNHDVFITNLESYIISHFPIKDLLNNECKAPKSNIIKLLELNHSHILKQADDSILFIEEIIKHSNSSLEELIKHTRIDLYRYYSIKRKVKLNIQELNAI